MDPDKHWQGLSSVAWSLDIELRASQYGDHVLMSQKVLQKDNPRSHPSGSGAEPVLIQQKNSEGKWRRTPLLESQRCCSLVVLEAPGIGGFQWAVRRIECLRSCQLMQHCCLCDFQSHP